MKHPFPFDPTYGYTHETLLRVGTPKEPDDFAQFWQSLYAQTLAIPPKVTKRKLPDAGLDYHVYEIEFSSLDGFRVGGWLTLPKHVPIRAGVVIGHGYGGRSGPEHWIAQEPVAAIFPCARGFNRSASEDWPDQAHTHVLKGIDSRNTYSHRACTADIWAAVSALLEIAPEIATHVTYAGGSFGGGIGALAVAWDNRFERAFLDVPSFGNHPLRVLLPCVGSGEAVRVLHATRPQILSVLRYFDAATAARYIQIPTTVAAALFDPAVPPPGQFAVYNAIPASKRLLIRQTAHFDGPEKPAEDARINRDIKCWLGWSLDFYSHFC